MTKDQINIREGIVRDSFSQNLPGEIIGYKHHEVNGIEFDFCLLIKDVGLAIIEFKGWDRERIFEKNGVDQIILTSSTKPERSPKKQARSYRFALLNILSDTSSFNKPTYTERYVWWCERMLNKIII